MHPCRVLGRPSAAIFCMVLLTAAASLARDGRDFAGYYALSNVQEQETSVQLTLTLQIFNYSGADIKDAVIHLQQSGAGAGRHGTYGTVKLFPKMRDIRISHDFTIPRFEYEMWQRGAHPTLSVTYKDADGHTWFKTVQLARRPALPTS